MRTLNEMEAMLGYAFQDRSLLETALTHPSFGADYHVPHYQRLEFLGDAVLELFVSERLYATLPHWTEGRLTRMRAELVCEDSLATAARRLGVSEWIRLSVGEERTGGREKSSILCDVMEALIGAAYLDGGRAASDGIITLALGERLSGDTMTDAMDAKSKLQAVLQKQGHMPCYTLMATEGPPHLPLFTYQVSAEGEILGKGTAHSKREAQANAAAEALTYLARHTTPAESL